MARCAQLAGSRGRSWHWGAGPSGSPLIEVQTEEGARLSVAALECPPQNERDDTVDDLVKSDFLHEPG